MPQAIVKGTLVASYLYRLGRMAYRRRRVVLAAWLLALVAVGAAAGALRGSTTDTFALPGTESQKAIDVLRERFPAAGGASARMVFAAPDGATLTDAQLQDAVQAAVADAGRAPGVVAAVDPYSAGAVSPDGRIAYATIAYAKQVTEITPADRDALFASGEVAEQAGVRVEYGGEAAMEQTQESATELIGVAAALAVLAVAFGSIVAAGLPLLTALIGVGIGVSGIGVASGLLDLSSTAPTLALMLGLAVGIDYALFIVSRHRQHLSEGMAVEESVALSTATAGSAVVFAGLTVVVALAGLSVVGIPFLTEMGVSAAATVVVAVLVALTLLPALLGFAGGTIDRLKVPGVKMHRSEDSAATGFVARWARLVTRRPLPVVLAALLGLAVVALPLADLRLGLPDEGMSAPDTTQRQAYDLLAGGFGPGFNGPLSVVVDAAGLDATGTEAAAERVRADLAGVPGVTAASAPSYNDARDAAVLTVIPATGPSDAATKDLVETIRDRAPASEAATGSDVSVTGPTALGIDFSTKLGDALPRFLLVVVGLSLLLLTVMFRSLLVPLKATAGFLLTIASTFGALVAVFQWGWLADLIGLEQTGPLLSFLPILMVGVLFGLAMDYEVFLVSRMREEHVHGAAPTAAVVTGLRHGARVVTSAALIMISVFAGFLLGDDPIIKSVGFALAFGVLVDAFVVRMTVVPAVMALLGAKAWALPGWLDRRLPNLDLEGERLRPTEPLLSAAPSAGADPVSRH